MKRAAVIFAVVALLATAAAAQRRDPPTFETDYTPPPTFARPEPRPWSTAMEYVDFAVLAAALGLGALFVLKLRSRAGVAAVMVFSLLYFGFYRMGCLCPIGSIQNVAEAASGEIRVQLDGDKIVAACSDIKPAPGQLAGKMTEWEFRTRLPKAMAASARAEFRKRLGSLECKSITDSDGAFSLTLRRNSWNRAVLGELAAVELPKLTPNAGAVKIGDIWRHETRMGALPWLVVGIFALPLVFALFFGRVFCGSVCPLGAVQDVVLVRPLRLPMWLEHALRLLAVGYLALAVLLAATGSIYLICAYDPFVSFFRIIPLGKFLRWGQQWATIKADAGEVFSNITGRWELLALPVSFLVIAMFVGRPYCRFLCPYGLLLRPLSRLSWRHASITPDECVQCRLCEQACPYNAIDTPTPAHRPSRWDRKRLAVVLAAAPVLIALGAWGGWALGEPLARAHLKIRLADRLEAEDYVRQAEVQADVLPAKIGDRVIRVEKQQDRLLALCEDGTRELWRRTLLDLKHDRVMPPLDEKLIRLALATDGAQGRAVVIVRWTHLDRLSRAEELKSFFHVSLSDGELLKREDLSVKYDPSEAFSRRRFLAGRARTSDASPGAPAKPAKEATLDEDVNAIAGSFHYGAMAVGVFLALAASWSLLALSVTRSRSEYEVNKASCVSCGRCFSFCPREHLRRKQKKERHKK
ncbi:MAG TPA: 4Fe-4S binding protein [Phycisphaerae bacterium]|nr:4Fe-4S binding protein [Phycisphaerae bacterium]